MLWEDKKDFPFEETKEAVSHLDRVWKESGYSKTENARMSESQGA